MRIALIGKMGSGKTTIANAITTLHHGERISFADKLKKDILKYKLTQDGQIIKSRDRALLQNYGQLRRNELNSLTYYSGELVTLGEGRHGSYLYNKITFGKAVTYESLGENYPTYWIEHLIKKINTFEKEKMIVVDDVRRINEAEALKKENFTFIKINCSDKIRLSRLKHRDGNFDLETLNDISESELDSILFDEQITNETTLEDVLKQFHQITSYVK
jgi:dephospho-CoA kinase